MDIQFIIGVITIIASMYGMLKFMLKDVQKEVEILENNQKEFKQEMRAFSLKFEASDRRLDQMHHRLDCLYRVILDRTYGNNIPSELKK